MTAQERLNEVMKEIEALKVEVRAEKIRNSTAEKQARIDRLILDLQNSELPCRLPIFERRHVLQAYMSSFCVLSHKESNGCPYAATCKEILATNKKGHGNTSRKTVVDAHRQVNRGIITVTIDGRNPKMFTGTSWKNTARDIGQYYKADKELTSAQISGFRHTGVDGKLKKIFEG